MLLPRRLATPVLAWGLWAAWFVVSALTLWLSLTEGVTSYDAAGFLLVGYASVGAVVAARRPGNAVGWLLLAAALTFSIGMGTDAYASLGSQPLHLASAWLAGWFWYLAVAVLGIFLPLVFPDGRPISPRWRSVMWLGATALTITALSAAFKPGPMLVNQADNPLAVGGAAGGLLATVEPVAALLLLLAAVLAMTSLVLRYRRSNGVERQQVKWFAFAAVVMFAGWAVAFAESLVGADWSQPIGAVGAATWQIAGALGIPAATAIAIFRYRLFDIDRVINRTLVYGALTATLVATFVVLVLVLRRLLEPVAGDSDLAVAASTLAVAALFRPARARIQGAVDRRFYRRKYDAAQTLDEFAVRLRHELDLDAVGADLCAAAGTAVQPTHVSLWIRP